MQSTWSVIKSSNDYGQWVTDGLPDIEDTRPNFEIVQYQSQRFVLVLDDSNSMGQKCGADMTKTECLQVAAYQFIYLSVPTGSYVGMLEFAKPLDTVVLKYLTLMLTDTDREEMAEPLLHLQHNSGATCIGCGIRMGIDEVLEGNGATAAGGYLIVITDGEETGDRPNVEDVTDEVLVKGVIVVTIFIMNNANQALRSLSERSGGAHYLAESLDDLITIFSQISQTDSTADNTFQIHTESFGVSKADFTSSIFVDATIGTNTVFSFTWEKENSPPNILISSPSGCGFSNKVYSGSFCLGGNISHTDIAQFKTIRLEIPGVAEVGEWTYVVEKSNSVGEMTSTVTSSAASADVEPIVIESGMGQTDVGDGEAAIVFAKLSQGYNPILGASVVATVSTQGVDPISINLYDNGAGSDIQIDDGIYSRYFTQFSGGGRYSVEINVRSGTATPGETRSKHAASKANYIPGFANQDGTVNVNPNGAVSNEGDGSANVGIQSQDLGNFTRVASAGSFDYSGHVDVSAGPAPDTFPPGRIIDLRLRQQNLSDYTDGVVLQFTAPGDDYDLGQARGYIIRYTFGDPTILVSNFESSSTINASNILYGNMSEPSLAGETETFILGTPELPVDESGNTVNNSRLAIAVKAFDESRNYGDSSNVAVINFFIAPVVIPVETATTDYSTLVTTESPTTGTRAATSTATTSTTPSTTSTTSSTTTSTQSTCPICVDCDEKITFFIWLTASLSVFAAITMTSTIILGIWLSKSNKQLARKGHARLKGVDNIQMTENNWRGGKHWSPTEQQTAEKTHKSNYREQDDLFDF